MSGPDRSGPEGDGGPEGHARRKAEEFYLQVAYALSGCQLVEQELKLYIAQAYQYIRKQVGKRLPFKMSGDDVENFALGRLIETFEKLSDNKALVADLSKFTRERNYLSHAAIAQCLDPFDEVSFMSADAVKGRLTSIQQEAERLRLAVHDEGTAFKGHLVFGREPD